MGKKLEQAATKARIVRLLMKKSISILCEGCMYLINMKGIEMNKKHYTVLLIYLSYCSLSIDMVRGRNSTNFPSILLNC